MAELLKDETKELVVTIDGEEMEIDYEELLAMYNYDSELEDLLNYFQPKDELLMTFWQDDNGNIVKIRKEVA